MDFFISFYYLKFINGLCANTWLSFKIKKVWNFCIATDTWKSQGNPKLLYLSPMLLPKWSANPLKVVVLTILTLSAGMLPALHHPAEIYYTWTEKTCNCPSPSSFPQTGTVLC